MVRIAVLDDYLHIAEKAADWASLPHGTAIDFFHDTLIEPLAIVKRLKPYDALVTTRERTRFPAEVLNSLTNLKLIAGTGRGQANVDLARATELRILVCTTGGTPTRGNSTAELAWGLIIAVTRHIAWEDRQMRSGRWQTRPAEGLGGKTLGILGMGRLGTMVAKYGRFFDMDVIAWGPTLDATRASANGAEYVPWDDLFRRSDILSIHVPLTDLSRGWITASELGLMRPTAYLVNTSRGPIVNEQALISALRGGRIAGAALDVYDIEPLPANHPFLQLENVLLTPHLGYSTVSGIRNFMVQSLANLRAWLDGSPTNVLNPEALPGRPLPRQPVPRPAS
jgi:phosphoglycerate dehydrogenase-like enzyme